MCLIQVLESATPSIEKQCNLSASNLKYDISIYLQMELILQ